MVTACQFTLITDTYRGYYSKMALFYAHNIINKKYVHTYIFYDVTERNPKRGHHLYIFVQTQTH